MIHKILLPLIIISTLFMTECMAEENATIKININLLHIASADVQVSTLANLEVILETTVDKNGNFFINPTNISKLSSDDYVYIYVDNIQVSQGDTPAYLKGIISIDSLSNNQALNLNEITTYVADLFFENRAKIADNYQLLSGIIRNLGVYDMNKDKRRENIDTFLYDSITTSSNLETILKLTYFYYLELNDMTKVNEYIQKKSKELSLFSYIEKVKGNNIDINFENLDGKYISARYVSTNQAKNNESNITTEIVSLKNGDALRYRLCLLEECSKEYTLYNDNGVIKPYIEDVSDPEIVKFGEKLAEYKKVQHLTPTRKKQKLLDIASILLDISKSDNFKRYELYLISEDNKLLDEDTSTVISNYSLNDISVTNENIVSKIKNTIINLETIKSEINTATDYDSLKSRLDGAMSKIDAIKQAIDNNIVSNDEKLVLKAEADKIKDAIESIKILIDGYKQDDNHSPEAIADINSKIDGVIGMMVTRSIDDTHQSNVISISRGWNLVSGNVNILTLPQEVHSIWNVGEANWYGFSPHKSIRGEIRDKYRLMDMHIRAYKGTQILATADTEIELIDDYQFNAIQSYGKGLTIHGANNKGFSVSDIQCNEPYTLYGVFKLNGEEIEVYSPNIEVNNYTNFDYIYKNDGYYTYCINK